MPEQAKRGATNCAGRGDRFASNSPKETICTFLHLEMEGNSLSTDIIKGQRRERDAWWRHIGGGDDSGMERKNHGCRFLIRQLRSDCRGSTTGGFRKRG